MADGLRKPEPFSFEGNVALNWKNFVQEVEIFIPAAHGDKNEKTKTYIFLKFSGKRSYREREIIRQRRPPFLCIGQLKPRPPGPPGLSGDLTWLKLGFNALFNSALAPGGGGFNKMSVNGGRGAAI